MKKLLINRWIHFLLLFVVLIVATLHSGSDSRWRKGLEYFTFDQLNRHYPRAVPPDHPVVIVDIDEESLVHFGQWPWPRDVVAKMVTNLAAMGAKVTAFDMVFAEPDRTSPQNIIERIPDTEEYSSARASIEKLPDNDTVFGDGIAAAGNVVTAFTAAAPEETLRDPFIVQNIRVRKDDKEKFLARSEKIRGAATNLPAISKHSAGSGSFMATPDIDGIIRIVSLIFSGEPKFRQKLYPALSIEALRVAEFRNNGFFQISPRGNRQALETEYLLDIGSFVENDFKPTYRIPIESDGSFRIHYRTIDREAEYIPAWKVIDPVYYEETKGRINGKIVFVGASPEGLKDIRSTPLNVFIPGVEVHVNVVEQILQQDFLIRHDFIKGLEIWAILLVGLAIIILAPFTGAFVIGAVSVLFIGGAVYASIYAYIHMGLLLDPFYASLCIGILFVVSALLTYIRTEAERRQVKQAFGFYISPDFMKELTKDPDKLRLGGETRELSVMFTDIRSFTTISESMSPEALIQLMNDFLTPMSDLVMSNRGTIDKYMGDAMMAFWNAPLDDAEHAAHACRTALKMNEALAPINDRLREQAIVQNRTPLVLNAGIGINTGPASVGNMGSKQRFAYSALGDTVNLASRLEGQTKIYGVNILIGQQTQKQVPDFATLELDLLRVKGKKEPVRVFTLLGDEEYAAAPSFRIWKQEHDAMIESYRARDFTGAERLVGECLRLSGGNLADFYMLYQMRIAEMKARSPGAGWDGVYEATTK